MTAVDDRPRARVQGELRPEEFEIIAADAARDVEGLRLEFIGGKLGFKTVPDAVHTAITMWLLRQCMQQKPQWDLHIGQGLRIETYREGRAIPDGVLAPVANFVGQSGEWVDPDGVLMVLEVTSYDRDTEQRDRIDKPRAYAESGIPVYLLIDRDARATKVYSEPAAGEYHEQYLIPFGKVVLLPEPVGIKLDTQQLLTWASAPES
ncbi:Uma2 family endonuclease [Actinacidiphila sp. bgisy144]|uniref:Uma2 family endonuclease n=1 Tax=unclassified Actinacidiphila TaxID=2995708 RepID=UPI003EBD8B67